MFNTGMRLTKSLQALPKANTMKQGTQSTFIKAACAQMHAAAAKPKFLHTFKVSSTDNSMVKYQSASALCSLSCLTVFLSLLTFLGF